MDLAETTQRKAGRPVAFPDWEAVLAASAITPDQRWRFATEISRFLRYCHILDTPVTRPRSREYLATVPLVGARPLARVALRWFFDSARSAKIPDPATTSDLLHPHRRRQIPSSETEFREEEISPRVAWFGSR